MEMNPGRFVDIYFPPGWLIKPLGTKLRKPADVRFMCREIRLLLSGLVDHAHRSSKGAEMEQLPLLLAAIYSVISLAVATYVFEQWTEPR